MMRSVTVCVLGVATIATVLGAAENTDMQQRRDELTSQKWGIVAPLRSVAAKDPTAQPCENMALGKQYKLWPAPNYPHCTDPDDTIQLTDGKTTTAYFWTQKGTVGWTDALYVTVTVDLGRDEPISGVAFDTAAGTAGAQWPAEIDVLVSSDGKAYCHAGELVDMDLKLHGPWPVGYASRRLVTKELSTHGRFVQFVVIPYAGSQYIFCDEVEVFRGPSSLLAQTSGPEVPPIKEFVQARKAELADTLTSFYETHARSLQWAILSARLPSAVESRLTKRRDEIRAELHRSSPRPTSASFRAVLPIGQAHERLFALQAELWKEAGCPAWSVWVPNAWDPVPLFGLPPKMAGQIEVHLMRGEYRAAAANLANSGSQPLRVRLRFEDATPGTTVLRDAVRLHAVEWTAAPECETVAAALPELAAGTSGPEVVVVPGLIRQVWLTFRVGSTGPSGQYDGSLVLEPVGAVDNSAVRIPLRLHIYPIDFPQETTLCLGGWCYTDGKRHPGITPANRTAFIQHLREHFVNCPWATADVMMQCKFPPGDPDTVELNTRVMDDWLAQWPGAKRYMVFLWVKPSWDGVKFDSADFPRRVKVWISAWVRHLKTKHISPDRLGLLIEDEPHAGTDVRPLVAWARAIHAAEPEVVIWEDPTYSNPARAPAELFDACQVLCPNRPMWLAGGERFAQVYLDQQRRGRTLQFYSCSGPARLLDPYSYYRLQAWHCWRIGATGSWFWSFGDNFGISSWNEYPCVGGPFTPLFLDSTSVVAGKHMEAIRESVEDYEYFVMLRQAINRAKLAGKTGPDIERADALLGDGVQQVLAAPDADKLFWRDRKDRGGADAVRLQILKSLVTLNR